METSYIIIVNYRYVIGIFCINFLKAINDLSVLLASWWDQFFLLDFLFFESLRVLGSYKSQNPEFANQYWINVIKIIFINKIPP